MSESNPDSEPSASSDPIDLDGLFKLYREADNTYRAEYGKLTAPRELGLRWKLHPSEGGLAMALLFISEGLNDLTSDMEVPAPRFGILGASNVGELYLFAQKATGRAALMGMILGRISDSIGTELAIVADHSNTSDAAKEASDKILKKVSKALEAVALRSERKAHGSATSTEVTLNTGETRGVLLSWLVLETARHFVAENQQLPTKGEIQLAIDEQYPEFRGLGKTKWRNTWKECALSNLDQGKPWEFEERKRATRPRTKRA